MSPSAPDIVRKSYLLVAAAPTAASQFRARNPRESSRNDAGTVTHSATDIAHGFGTPRRSTATQSMRSEARYIAAYVTT